MDDTDIKGFEEQLAGEVSKDVFKFDSFLIYILGFFFGFLLAIGLSFFVVGSVLSYQSASYTNLMVLFAGLGLGGVAIVGGFAVWQRLWLLLLKVAIAAMAGFVWLYVLLVLAYVISHDIRSPMREFADGNWREGAAIATTELEPDYCIAKVPQNCVSPLKATSGSVIISGDACDVKCKEAWVKDADESMKPLGFCLYLLCIVLIATVVINNQVLEDDGFDKTREHYIAYGLNAALFVFGLVTAIVTMATASSDSNLTLWLILFSLIVMGACASAAIGIFQNFDWSIRITNVVLLFVFLFLMGLAILTSFYGENMSTAASFYDDNWEDIKEEIREKDPNLCIDLSDDECKSRFKSKSSKQIAFVAYGCAGVEAFLLVLIWLTVRGVRFWRRVPESEDISFGAGDEDTLENPVAEPPAPAEPEPDPNPEPEPVEEQPAPAPAPSTKSGGKKGGKKGKKGKKDEGKKFANPLNEDAE